MTQKKGKYDIEKVQVTGFIAQDVDKAAQKIGYDFSGVDKAGKIWGLRYSDFVVPLEKQYRNYRRRMMNSKQDLKSWKPP